MLFFGGMVCFWIGISKFNFNQFCLSLKDIDTKQWQLLGKPSGHCLSFKEFRKTLRLYSWIKNGGHKKLPNNQIIEQAELANKRAKLSLILILSGLLLMFSGIIIEALDVYFSLPSLPSTN
jgi:hypothetical protein